MKKPKLDLFPILILILSFSAIVFACVESFIFDNATLSLGEGGILELMQIVVLVASILMYIPAIIGNNGDERWISLCLVGIFYLFVLRELEIKNMDVPDYVKYIFHGTGRRITAITLIGTAVIGALIRYKHYITKTISLLFSFRGALLWGAFAFLQVGQWLEKVDFKYNVLCEESLELIGYCLLLLCAFYTMKLANYKKIY